MKRIAIFQSDFNVGGVQKSLINILRGIDYDKCAVDLFIYEDSDFYELPENENLHVRKCRPYPFFTRMVPFGLVRLLARAPERDTEYDVAIDFNSYRHECAVGALGVRAKKRVMWIHNDVEIKLRNEPKYRLLHGFFKSKIKYFDEFAAVSPGIIEGFRRANNVPAKPIHSIPNHIDTQEIFRGAEEKIDFAVSPENYNLCTMGRLCHQKGYDILIDELAKVHALRPDIKLYMLGDGPDRQALEAQIAALGLGDTVTLLGNKKNPFPYLDRMDGFVLTSRYEGQGMAIWEAKSLGLEIFISKNLEPYNPGIPGYEDIAEALCHAQRREKVRDDLTEYNAAISASLNSLFGL